MPDLDLDFPRMDKNEDLLRLPSEISLSNNHFLCYQLQSVAMRNKSKTEVNNKTHKIHNNV